jgi:hypothetical protein
MAVTISIELSDAEYAVAQAAFAADDGDGNAVTIDAAYLKAKLVSVLTSRVRNYDDARASVSYSSFSPS